MKDEMSESIDKKSFFMLAAYTAETANDQYMVDQFEKSIEKYQQAKATGADEKKLTAIFMEISILSYINVIRMAESKAEDMIKDMQSVDRVLDLIKPINN